MKKRNYPVVIALLLLLAGMAGRISAQGPLTKSPLKILFVGYDPARMPAAFRKGMDEFSARDSIRMPAFKDLLSNYFAQVRTMDCRDWKVEDAAPYDVIIFDYPTTLLEKRIEGESFGRYLPDNFSKPVVFIASTAPIMGGKIGLKLDWLCLCLDADAHHINTRHPIFNGPLEKVVPTLTMEKTPDGVYHYPSGDTIPKQIPMWKVQTLSYMHDEHVRIGLVSRGYRFSDSPDAEVISSGVCQKDVTAVALGRHGNFFLWGFSASPANMTEEAKKVFVNAVAYMKQFDGQTPIARKYNDRMATTDDIRAIAASTTQKVWQESVEENHKFNVQVKEEVKKWQAQKDSGKTLTDQEQQLLAIYSNSAPTPDKTWEEFLKQMMGPLADKFGTDAAAFQKYIWDNMGYMYCDPKGFYTYEVDEDVKKLQVSNHSLKMLEVCIRMLKNGQDTALALRVLKRYTPESFETASAWSIWYGSNKKHLFFTETGGYKFLINTLKS